MKKKALALLLVGCMLSVTACGNSNNASVAVDDDDDGIRSSKRNR